MLAVATAGAPTAQENDGVCVRTEGESMPMLMVRLPPIEHIGTAAPS